MFFPRKKETVTTGRVGEQLAADYLVGLGYVLLARNYRTSFAEVDLIARDRQTVVFIEVKTRHSAVCGTPFEAVDQRKQRQLSRIAQEYLHTHGLADTAARFDVISVRLHRDHRPPAIDHLQNAFDVFL